MASNDCCSGTFVDTLRWKHYWLVSAIDIDCKDRLLLLWFIFRSEFIETIRWIGGIKKVRAKCHGFTSLPPSLSLYKDPYDEKLMAFSYEGIEKPWVFNIARCQWRCPRFPTIMSYLLIKVADLGAWHRLSWFMVITPTNGVDFKYSKNWLLNWKTW